MTMHLDVRLSSINTRKRKLKLTKGKLKELELRWREHNRSCKRNHLHDFRFATLEEYIDYAEFVLFHEYIHCLGNFTHNKDFRLIENLWPNKKQMNLIGKKLTRELQNINSKWAWTCSKCGFIVRKSTRKFRSNYFHKECKGKLENIPIIHPTKLEH